MTCLTGLIPEKCWKCNFWELGPSSKLGKDKVKLYFDKRKKGKCFSSGLLKKTVLIIITYEHSKIFSLWHLETSCHFKNQGKLLIRWTE